MAICVGKDASTANPMVRGGAPARAKVLVCALIAELVFAAMPGAAPAGPISFDFKPQKLFGHETSGKSNLTEVYFTGNGWGVTFLEPTKPLNPIDYATSAGQGTLYYNFFNVLNRDYSANTGWTIVGNAQPFADNSLQINTYSAVGTDKVVGADFALTYVVYPNGGGVSNGNPVKDMRWIQVVSNNNALITIGGVVQSLPGTYANQVDISRGVGRSKNPYYDSDEGAADFANFLDQPSRTNVEYQNDWIATLFRASGPINPGTPQNPETITVYNSSGITWGWQNFFFPDVDEVGFKHDVEQDVFGQDQLGQLPLHLDLGGPQDTPVTVDLLSSADYAPYEKAFLASVPEPSAWALMLAGLGALGVTLRSARRPAGSRQSQRA
jgi:hypothetical protein